MLLMVIVVYDEKHFRMICQMTYYIIDIATFSHNLWPNYREVWFVIYSTRAFDCAVQMHNGTKLKTFDFDLGWKSIAILSIEHNDIMSERNRSTRSWVKLTDRQTDKHDKVNTCWHFTFSYVRNRVKGIAKFVFFSCTLNFIFLNLWCYDTRACEDPYKKDATHVYCMHCYIITGIA